MGNLLKWAVVGLAAIVALGAVVNAKRAKKKNEAEPVCQTEG